MVDRVAKIPDFSAGVWAEQGDLSSPTEDKVQTGHIVEKPPFQLVNWIENRQDEAIYYLLQNGISPYSSSMFYPVSALTKKDNVYYVAKQQNVNVDPNNTEYWERAFYSYTEGQVLEELIENIRNTEGYLNLYVSKTNPVMTGVALGVGYSFSTAKTSGLYRDDGETVVKEDGVRSHSFSTISDYSSEDNDKIVRMKDLRKVLELQQAFKVGSIYITTTDANPTNELGYGVWERYSKGRVLVGLSDNTSDPDWKRNLGRTFGSDTHTLTVEEMPSHDHALNAYTGLPYAYAGDSGRNGGSAGTGDPASNRVGSTGGGQSHNNVQPSIVVAIWRRLS